MTPRLRAWVTGHIDGGHLSSQKTGEERPPGKSSNWPASSFHVSETSRWARRVCIRDLGLKVAERTQARWPRNRVQRSTQRAARGH